MHSDTISVLLRNNEHLYSSEHMIDIKKLIEADYLLQCFAMFIPYLDPRKENYSPYTYCNEMIDKYYEEMELNKDYIRPVYTYEDIETNIKDNKISSLLTIEEGGVCLGDLEKLEHFYNRGVRLMTITWNFKNELACPNIDYTNMKFDSNEPPVFTANTVDGLTEKGIEFIRRMNELGMVIDCSHASDKTFYDCIKYSNKPIVCSHSNARSVCDFPRNMTDDMLYKLKENGGVVGINFCHDFIKQDESDASIKDVVEHINYIRNLIGVDYIALGSDFDGISNEDIELKDATKMPLLLEELRNQNYTQEEIDKISHLNVLRVLKQII